MTAQNDLGAWAFVHIHMAVAAAVGIPSAFVSSATVEETALAFVGGLVGGWALLRSPITGGNRPGVTDEALTVIYSAFIGAISGPVITNYGTHVFPFVQEGLLENLAGGFVAGIFVPIFILVLVAIVRAGRENPETVLAFLKKVGEIWRSTK